MQNRTKENIEIVNNYMLNHSFTESNPNFVKLIWYILNFVKMDPKKIQRFGIGWESPDVFLLNKKQFCTVFEMRMNTLSINLRKGGFSNIGKDINTEFQRFIKIYFNQDSSYAEPRNSKEFKQLKQFIQTQQQSPPIQLQTQQQSPLTLTLTLEQQLQLHQSIQQGQSVTITQQNGQTQQQSPLTLEQQLQ